MDLLFGSAQGPGKRGARLQMHFRGAVQAVRFTHLDAWLTWSVQLVSPPTPRTPVKNPTNKVGWFGDWGVIRLRVQDSGLRARL